MAGDNRIKISKTIDANPHRHFMPIEMMKKRVWEELKYKTAKAIFKRLPDNGDPVKIRMKPFQYDHVGYDDNMELCYVFELTAIPQIPYYMEYESPPFEAPPLSVPSYVVRNPTWCNVWQAVKLLAYMTPLNHIRSKVRKLTFTPRLYLSVMAKTNPRKYRQIRAILLGLAMVGCLAGLVILGEVW